MIHLDNLGDHIIVPIPKDEKGYLGRECPEAKCLGYFKVKPGTGLSGRDLPCICPYCGYKGPHARFWTRDQINYAKSVAKKTIIDAVRADFQKLEFEIEPQGPFGIGISFKLEPGAPIPIQYYREKNLETNIICSKCSLDYSVYGVFAFCPDCGEHNSLQILQKNLALIRKQVEHAVTIEDLEFHRHLVEDALENCVSAFDGFAREACRLRASMSSDPKQAKNLSFQNLQKVSAKLKVLFDFDFERTIDSHKWIHCHEAFMQRHLIAHHSGVVDQQYLNETQDKRNILGRRVAIEPSIITALTFMVEELGHQLLSRLPKIPERGI